MLGVGFRLLFVTGLQLLESLPPPMAAFFSRLRELPFNARPDYTFFKKCFEELAELGDSSNLRRRFGGGSNQDAIAREIYGRDALQSSWNPHTPRTAFTSTTVTPSLNTTTLEGGPTTTKNTVRFTKKRARVEEAPEDAGKRRKA